jgi:hypothetical protein
MPTRASRRAGATRAGRRRPGGAAPQIRGRRDVPQRGGRQEQPRRERDAPCEGRIGRGASASEPRTGPRHAPSGGAADEHEQDEERTQAARTTDDRPPALAQEPRRADHRRHGQGPAPSSSRRTPTAIAMRRSAGPSRPSAAARPPPPGRARPGRARRPRRAGSSRRSCRPMSKNVRSPGTRLVMSTSSSAERMSRRSRPACAPWRATAARACRARCGRRSCRAPARSSALGSRVPGRWRSRCRSGAGGRPRWRTILRAGAARDAPTRDERPARLARLEQQRRAVRSRRVEVDAACTRSTISRSVTSAAAPIRLTSSPSVSSTISVHRRDGLEAATRAASIATPTPRAASAAPGESGVES